MHGIAFDAEIKGAAAGNGYHNGSFYSRDDLYAYYLQHPEIKIINNSWMSSYQLENISDKEAYELLQMAFLLLAETRYGKIVFITKPLYLEKWSPKISF